MKKKIILLTCATVATLAAGCGCAGESISTSNEVPVVTSTSTPTPVPTVTSTPTPVPTATNTPVPTNTSTPTPTPSPTNTPIPTNTPTPTPIPYTYKEIDSKIMYVKDSVNVRELPTSDSEKVGSLSAWEVVLVTGQCVETGWYRITFQGNQRYISDKYVVESKPTATPTVTPKPTNTPKPKATATPKPSNKPELEIVEENGIEGVLYHGVFVPSVEGVYVNGYVVLLGLSEYTGLIPMTSTEERLAWSEIYGFCGGVDENGVSYLQIKAPKNERITDGDIRG